MGIYILVLIWITGLSGSSFVSMDFSSIALIYAILGLLDHGGGMHSTRAFI